MVATVAEVQALSTSIVAHLPLPGMSFSSNPVPVPLPLRPATSVASVVSTLLALFISRLFSILPEP